MKHRFFQLIYLIFGDPKKNSLEHRLFNAISFVNGSLNIVGSVFLEDQEYYYRIIALNLISGIALLAMYYYSRVKSVYYALFWPLNLTILFYLSSLWFLNAGSQGGNHYYFIPALVIATILLRNHNVFVIYGLYAFVTGFLYFVEFIHPNFIVPHANRNAMYMDLGGNYIFVQILTGILIFILSRNLNIERKKSDNLLRNILPEQIADELKRNDTVKPKRYDSVTVLFTDMAGFTNIAEKMSPEELVGELHFFFAEFDKIAGKYHMEKIKTIGDAYMAAGGLPEPNHTHAIDAVLCGLEFQEFMKRHKEERTRLGLPTWELRLGIHTGSVVAGVIGTEKFAYDIWGDTVNTASRMESSGLPGEVNISKQTFHLVRDQFLCESRGLIKAKNKGEIEMFLVKGLRSGGIDQNQTAVSV
ncbi:adenylate/guanylate cyclase domain-containing protein [Leptospira wolffii]|uniref:adenylate/guanylate cyclase domain-containing protein n=1 Tax=Leptospira wolffii TaxID=409998 RepID=UPI0002DD1620|nr:adenylate/guanylate cyclase domain-containing protein [Leptospira wolffii]EPG67173.1 adenylate/guanylate cyclase catalytic domain protein [Leptospira wolffii serovar Khorat str. Khorat-H2]